MLSKLLLYAASVCILIELLLLHVVFLVIDQLQCTLTELLLCVMYIAASSSASSSCQSCFTSDIDENKKTPTSQEDIDNVDDPGMKIYFTSVDTIHNCLLFPFIEHGRARQQCVAMMDINKYFVRVYNDAIYIKMMLLITCGYVFKSYRNCTTFTVILKIVL